MFYYNIMIWYKILLMNGRVFINQWEGLETTSKGLCSHNDESSSQPGNTSVIIYQYSNKIKFSLHVEDVWPLHFFGACILRDPLQVRWVPWNQAVRLNEMDQESESIPSAAWEYAWAHNHMVSGFVATPSDSMLLLSHCSASGWDIFFGQGWAIPEINSISVESMS